MRARDQRTPDFFQIPVAPEPTGGSLNFDARICVALSDMFRASGKDRYAIAAEMSRLLGREVSKNMLDAYTAESRDAYNFPLNYLAAAEVVCQSFALTELINSVRGCRMLVGEEALLAELGRIERDEQQLKERKSQLRAYLSKGGKR